MAVFKRNRATVVAEGQLEIAEFRGKTSARFSSR